MVRAFAAASLLLTSSAFATAYYVSPTGSDNNNGAPSKPLATVMKAVSFASSGDTIYLNTGTYSVPNTTNSIQDGAYAVVNLINKSGITIKAVSGASPVLDFSAVKPPGTAWPRFG